MEWQAWLTMATVGAVLVALITTNRAPDVLLTGAVGILLLAGVLAPGEALSGLANEGLGTVAVLFVVATGLRDTGIMSNLAQRLLGRPKSLVAAQVRLILPTLVMSGFLNNTPLVAILLPVVTDWAKRLRMSASKLLIPLSYAAILGGTCTLIGTSTNLVVNGMVLNQLAADKTAAVASRLHAMGMFEITLVGLPCAIVGVAYLLLLGRRLLPDRLPAMGQFDDPRQYTVEMMVEPGSPLVGRTIEQAGLRHLPGMYLMEIERDGQVLTAVGPSQLLEANDRLVFVGVVESVVDLQKIRGLTPATNQVFKLDAPRALRCLIEAVVSNTCPLVGRTVRESRFRTRYNAVVIAVARNGERIRRKIGDIELRAGDTLLLEASPSFADEQRNSRDFYLVSRVEGSAPPRHERAGLALLILLGMVAAATAGLNMFIAALTAAGLMIVTRCCTATDARKSIDLQLLIVIASAFALGKAVEVSGAAEAIASTLIGFAGDNPWFTLAVIYGITMVFTEIITNNAAAVLVFPIAINAADSLDVNPMPFVAAIMMAASASFSTPIGYQTNLMVYGPGGYRFTDYFRVGIPMNLLLWATTVALAPVFWPF